MSSGQGKKVVGRREYDGWEEDKRVGSGDNQNALHACMELSKCKFNQQKSDFKQVGETWCAGSIILAVALAILGLLYLLKPSRGYMQ